MVTFALSVALVVLYFQVQGPFSRGGFLSFFIRVAKAFAGGADIFKQMCKKQGSGNILFEKCWMPLLKLLFLSSWPPVSKDALDESIIFEKKKKQK